MDPCRLWEWISGWARMGLLRAGSITQFLLQGSLPVLPCIRMEFFGRVGLSGGKTLLCCPCLNHSGISGHFPVRVQVWLGGSIQAGHAQGGMWGCSCQGPKEGDPTCGAWGCPARSLYAGKLFERIKPLNFCWFSGPLWIQNWWR